MEYLNRPMGVGAILDRSFQLYRNHFATAFLLMLLFVGPFYLLQNLLLYNLSSVPLLPQAGDSIADSLDLFISRSNLEAEALNPGLLFFSFLLMPLYAVLLLPVLMSSQLHLVQTALQGQEVRFSEVLRQSFGRYGRVIGNSLLYGLIITGISIGIWIALVIVIVIVVALTAGLAAGLPSIGSGSLGGSIVLIIVGVVVYILVALGIWAGLSFFMIRFGFFLPIVALEDGEGAIGRSWRLTKGSFWRIFAVLLLLSVLYSIFALGSYALMIGVFKMSLIGQLINVLLVLLIAPLFTIPYAVIYFDLRVRNEGSDLENYLQASAPGGQPRVDLSYGTTGLGAGNGLDSGYGSGPTPSSSSGFGGVSEASADRSGPPKPGGSTSNDD
ncbi:hypothetical protein WMW72_30770 [Paenibacillus filicis]|uniref:Glycerophosphoryl diester phosphodiesterase membrane domain-containing protein n=1 Tax=Paenibacillus filicis TaxID=669464 RepID=A0ABU9DTT2_9BACL